MKYFYCHLLAFIVIALFSCPVLAHSGNHESKNCFLTIDQNTLRLSGYQFQGLHPNQAYCRIFPYLGDLIIKIEPVTSVDNSAQISLQLAKLTNWLNFNSDSAFQVFKMVPPHYVKEGVNMIQTTIKEPGVYAIQVVLEQGNRKGLQQSFWFLVGVPIAQISVIISSLIFLLIVIIFLKQNLKSK
jgi:hypothetical protein